MSDAKPKWGCAGDYWADRFDAPEEALEDQGYEQRADGLWYIDAGGCRGVEMEDALEMLGIRKLYLFEGDIEVTVTKRANAKSWAPDAESARRELEEWAREEMRDGDVMEEHTDNIHVSVDQISKDAPVEIEIGPLFKEEA